MLTVAGITTIPITVALALAVGGFLAWATVAIRDQRGMGVSSGAAASSGAGARSALPARAALPTPVQVVVGRHYAVAAPDDDAVRVAMSHRVRAPLAFPQPVAVPREVAADPVSLPRSA